MAHRSDQTRHFNIQIKEEGCSEQCSPLATSQKFGASEMMCAFLISG